MEPSPSAAADAAAPPTQSAPDSSSHPPYTEMIFSAITALKEPEGSSRRAIAKYIESTYQGLGPNHSSLLTQHLNSLKDNELLIMDRNSYKLPASTTNPNAADIVGSNSIDAPKRGRGRPPKGSHPQRIPDSHSETVVAKRGRGRPAQVKAKSVGRPKKLKSVLAVNSAARKRPGRPRKNQQALVVPYANGGISSTIDGSLVVNVLPKRRGRPKKIADSSTALVPSGKLPVRRPGKPRKRTSGRPVGRPRKDATQLRQKAEAYVDLHRKLELFQSKVMEAVVVLKPLFTTETSSSAVAVLQQLEGLAAMDIAIPLGLEAPQVPQA